MGTHAGKGKQHNQSRFICVNLVGQDVCSLRGRGNRTMTNNSCCFVGIFASLLSKTILMLIFLFNANLSMMNIRDYIFIKKAKSSKILFDAYKLI